MFTTILSMQKICIRLLNSNTKNKVLNILVGCKVNTLERGRCSLDVLERDITFCAR